MSTLGEVVRRGSRWLPLIGLVALTGSLTTLALPAVLGRAVDAIVAGRDSRDLLLLAIGLVTLNVLCRLVDTFASTACTAGTTAWLRRRLIDRVLNAGPERTRELDTGDLVSRVSGSAADTGQAGPLVVGAVTALLPPVGSLVLLAYIHWWLALAFLCGVLLVLLVLGAFARRTTVISVSYSTTQGRIAARLTESLTGIRTIAAAGTAERERDRVLEPLPELHRQGMGIWLTLARSGAQAAVVGPLVLVSVLTIGGLLLVDGRISAGDLFAAGQYAVLGAGLGGLTGLAGELGRARAGARRIADVLRLEPFGYGGLALPPGPGRLEFDDVTVLHPDPDRPPLLDRVRLSLPGGSTVAVVGPSGAGKSVLAALAARLRDPDAGQVRLDGVPLRALSSDALRAGIGVAFERPVLVGATVADAIGFGSTDRVEEAARATHAHDFVSRLPSGYDTLLPEAPMSGGEAQRLGLARAWPAGRLLVLDDATSSLDTATEVQISRTLIGTGGRTRLVVTHRASTAARADLVVWLDDGQVRAVGPHQRLWADHPGYSGAFG